MKRRQFLNAASALAVGGQIVATKAQAQGGAAEGPSPMPDVFGFEEVAALAADRATRVYTQPVAEQVAVLPI
ncbi:hypothetical protein [Paracoccus methylarcula]|uniref:hypothetical protein n=1 Tax=Paracoccus methylarcula TaxID=72022 RepID=UPI001FE2D26B|nr:hypothetical protein [Paracoccus methylarcula]